MDESQFIISAFVVALASIGATIAICALIRAHQRRNSKKTYKPLDIEDIRRRVNRITGNVKQPHDDEEIGQLKFDQQLLRGEDVRRYIASKYGLLDCWGAATEDLLAFCNYVNDKPHILIIYMGIRSNYSFDLPEDEQRILPQWFFIKHGKALAGQFEKDMFAAGIELQQKDKV